VVGTAFNVERTYLGSQFAYGDGVTLVYATSVGRLEVCFIYSRLGVSGLLAEGCRAPQH
jgi:hypothetical protein